MLLFLAIFMSLDTGCTVSSRPSHKKLFRAIKLSNQLRSENIRDTVIVALLKAINVNENNCASEIQYENMRRLQSENTCGLGVNCSSAPNSMD